MHILSDLGVWSAYVAIPCVLVYFVLRKRDIPFRTIFLLFGAFILACGTTHLMEAIIFWWPAYRLAGLIKLFTAVVSWATVFALIPVAPKVLAMRSPEELEREIAARKQAEAALHQTNVELERRVEERTAELNQAVADLKGERELLQTTLSSITDAFYALSNNWRFTYVNAQAERLLNRQPGDLLGQVLWDELPRFSGTEFEHVYRRVMSERVALSVTSYYPDHDRWYEVRVFPAADGITVYIQDVTERKRAQEVLRESEEMFRLLAETIPQLAWMARPDGDVYWFNRGWHEYTGTTPEQMANEGWKTVHDPEVLPKVMEAWQESLATGTPFEMVFPIRAADGHFRPFLTRVNPLRDEQGRIQSWFGTNTDISEMKKMEQALRDADRRKDEFLATLAHELRNPLAPIRNSLQILKMPGVDETTIRNVREMMERQVHHLVRLVDDLLDVSRVMRGKIDLRRERIEVATVVARAVETVQPFIEAQGHELFLDLSDESLLLHADPVRLTQVIGNLLTNGAKYTHPNGRIWVTARRDGNRAVLRVRDNGIGIVPDMLEHVFELFVQADHGTARSQGGLGIGLTLVKNLVGMHDGTVVANSAGLGEGSEFVVSLPLIDQENLEPETDKATLDVTPNAATRHSVLVVDDNIDAAETLAMLLRLQGHEVRVAHNGPTALEMALSMRPDLIFLDIGMPGMDGFEVARRIRQQNDLEKVVLVALTGWGQELDRRRTSEAGFDKHLVKPPDVNEIFRLLANLNSAS